MTRLGSLPPRDLERLSAYLDGDLPPQDAKNLEARLGREPDLRQALDELRLVVSAVRGLPEVRVPRDFTLRGADVTRPASKAFPYLRFATVLATALFVLTTGIRTVSSVSLQLGAAAPAVELSAEGQQELFRDAAGTSVPTSEAAAVGEVAAAGAAATQTPVGTIVAPPTPGPAGTASAAPAGTSAAPSLVYGAETGALGPSDETAGADAVRTARVAPPVDPVVVAQAVLGAGALLLLVLTVRSRRRR